MILTYLLVESRNLHYMVDLLDQPSAVFWVSNSEDWNNVTDSGMKPVILLYVLLKLNSLKSVK